MIKSRIKVFYQYDGPSKSAPFREELAQNQIEEHLGRFPDELAHALDGSDREATVELVSSNLAGREIFLSIECYLPTKEYDNALKRTLNGLDLFAEQLELTETQ